MSDDHEDTDERIHVSEEEEQELAAEYERVRRTLLDLALLNMLIKARTGLG